MSRSLCLPAFVAAVAVGLLAGCAATPVASSAGATEPCDATCLEGLLSGYVDALAARDPSAAPVAPTSSSPRTG